MTPENRRLNVTEEWALSEEEWLAGEQLLQVGLFRPAVSRYYYSLFHAVRSLLLSEGVEPRTHQGIQNEFYRRFVRDGPLSSPLARVFSHLQKDREDADYSRSAVFSEESARAARASATSLREAIRSLLGQGGWL